MRAPPTGPRAKRSGRTATTAFRTLTFRYTLMLVTFTTVVRLTTTLLTKRGPPQPTQVGRPTKGSRAPPGHSGCRPLPPPQLTPGTPIATRTLGVPKNATSAGA